MDKLTAIKIKYDDGTYSDEIPVSVLSENVEWDSTHTLVDILGSIDVDVTGTIQDQISQLFNEKVSLSELNNYVASQLNIDITNWLNTNVNPVGSAVIVDSSLTVSGAAADAKITGTEIFNLKNDLTAISENAINLIDLTNIQLGKNWMNQPAVDRAILYVPVSPSTDYYFSFPQNTNFRQIDAIQKSSTTSISLESTSIPNGGNKIITTVENATYICIQFSRFSGEITSMMFDNYEPFMCEGTSVLYTAIDKIARQSINDVNTNINNVNTKLDNVTEYSNLIDFTNIIIGKNWLGGSDAGRAVLYIDALPNTTYYFNFVNTGTFNIISAIEKTSQSSGTAIASHNMENKSGNFKTASNTGVICIQFAKLSTSISVSDFDGYNPFFASATAIDYVARKQGAPWQGKTLVWLGTSIPAGGKYNISNPNSYPIMVGEILGATVYNEAVGSSALHCKSPNRISTSNPYGFLSNFEAVSRCITNSLEEMEWIIEHYNDSNVFTNNVPSFLSDDDKEFIRSCSWEIKLKKYFTADTFPDAWIIDHGHNDIPSVSSEATYTEKKSIQGTQHNGYYTGGKFVESTASSYIEFDVTNELNVWISGTFGSYYDVYDIYDSDGNNIGHIANSAETNVNELNVNVINATTLRVSNVNILIKTVNVETLKYPLYDSLYSYNGAFDFIVNKILTYNPRARIIMIGEYENQKYPTISENQMIAAKRWELPIYKQWENLGWSQQPIMVDGKYKSMLNIIIPDNLHPHTDTTGFALRTIARNISAWLCTIN